MPETIPVAVITGASSGIGQAIAIEFARAGYRVLVHGNKNRKGLLKTERAVNEINGHKRLGLRELVKPVLEDLSNTSGIERFFAAASGWNNRLDAWVNAAGADVLTGNARELSFGEKLQLLWRVDVQSTLLLSRLAAEFIRNQKTDVELAKPCIINISWDQADRGMAGDSGQYFSTVKAAITAFTRSLAMTIGPQIRANCLAPGWIQTGWGDQASQDWQQRAVGESSLNRWGTPSDVALAATWLASKSAEFINGQTISVNGGWKPNY